MIRLDERVDSLVNGLIELGMSPLEARAYVTLSLGGPMQSNSLTVMMDIPESQLRQTLHNLGKKGFIYVDSREGDLYAAIDPVALIRRLKDMEKDVVKRYNRRADEVQIALQSMVQKRKKSHRFTADQPIEYDFARYIEGQEIFSEMKELIKDAKSSIIRIISSTGLKFNTNNGVVGAELDAVKRGVKIRSITDINANNLPYAMEYSKHVQLRHFGGSSYLTRFVIIDGVNGIVLTSQPSLFDQDYSAFFTKSRNLLGTLENSFETIWPLSVPSQERIRNIINNGERDES